MEEDYREVAEKHFRVVRLELRVPGVRAKP
jgi:hypothetical protein